MNFVNKCIDMVAMFNKTREPKPIRFRVSDEDGEQQVFKIEKIMSKDAQRVKSTILGFLIVMNGFQRLFEIRYNKFDINGYCTTFKCCNYE
jgi:hypothetical protein